MKKRQNILVFCAAVISAFSMIGGAAFFGSNVNAADISNSISTSSRQTISLASVTIDTTTYYYDGTPKKPNVTVKDQYGNTVSPVYYTVGYFNNVKAGTATVTITANGIYTGTLYRNYTIKPKNISDIPVTLSATDFTYSGQERNPVVLLTEQGKSLSRETDYTLSYYNNINTGTATVKIMGKGNYSGIVSQNYTISGINIGKFNISLSENNYIYDGTEHCPAVTVSSDGQKLVNGTHYTVSYVNNVNAGTATVIIKGMGNYGGTVEEKFRISPRNFTKTAVSGINTSYKYTGKKLTPTVTVKYGSDLLVKDTDYTVTYKNNKEIGTATVTVKGRKNYTGTITKTFRIIPDTVKLKSVTSTKSKRISVVWTGSKTAAGYEIVYSDNKYFLKNIKTRYITKNTVSSTVVSGLTKGRTYYVKVRAYKTIDGKKIYGAYSEVKTVKVK